MFDPRNPYHRRRWHYDSDQPLSVPQLIALGSVDARTAALLWLLIERHRSVIVSGPTDPTPGIGKTTTLNSLLGFLPPGATMVYTMGMYEDFDFLSQTDAESTCVLANEVSNHLPIYMWGRAARRFLRLPADGYAVATSCHADTLADVLEMLGQDLRLAPDEIGRLGAVVNIGLVGRVWPARRRFLTVTYLCPPRPDAAAGGASAGERQVTPCETLRLATWKASGDCFVPAPPEVMGQLAEALGMTPEALEEAVGRRASCLAELSSGRGANLRASRAAIEELMEQDAQAGGASDATTPPTADVADTEDAGD
jgi:hypothetical protein